MLWFFFLFFNFTFLFACFFFSDKEKEGWQDKGRLEDKENLGGDYRRETVYAKKTFKEKEKLKNPQIQNVTIFCRFISQKYFPNSYCAKYSNIIPKSYVSRCLWDLTIYLKGMPKSVWSVTGIIDFYSLTREDHYQNEESNYVSCISHNISQK